MIICHVREPHMPNRNSSYHPAPILVQLSGLASVLPRVCVFGPRLRYDTRDGGRAPGWCSRRTPVCGGTRAPGCR